MVWTSHRIESGGILCVRELSCVAAEPTIVHVLPASKTFGDSDAGEKEAKLDTDRH